MDYRSYLLGHPLFWYFIAAFFLGAAAAQFTVAPSRSRNPARTRRRRPIKIHLFLSVAVLAATYGIFLALPEPFPRAAVVAAGSSFLVGALGTRFKRSVGIPLVLIAVLAVFAGRSVLRPWTAFSGTARPAEIRVLRTDGGGSTLLVAIEGMEDAVVDVSGRDFTVRADLLRLDELYFFLGRKDSYRFVELPRRETPARPRSPMEDLRQVLAEKFLGLPGVHREELAAGLGPFRLFSTYGIEINSEKGLVIVER